MNRQALGEPSSAEEQKIVLLDDHAMYAEGAAELLKTKGFEHVRWFTDPKVVLQSEIVGQTHLLLLDLRLGKNSRGIDLIPALRAINPELKIIVVTMMESFSFFKPIQALQVEGFISKLDESAVLIKAIRSVFAGLTYYSSSIQWLDTNELEFNLPTAREVEVLEALSRGLSSKEIANRLNMSYHTVETHKRRLLQKTKSNSLIELINFGHRHNLIDNTDK